MFKNYHLYVWGFSKFSVSFDDRMVELIIGVAIGFASVIFVLCSISQCIFLEIRIVYRFVNKILLFPRSS